MGKAREYINLLLAGHLENYSIHLIAGQPANVLGQGVRKGMVFRERAVFCYTLSSGKQASGWIVLNSPGSYALPSLKRPAILLLEVTGKLRVSRLLATLALLKQHGIDLHSLGADAFVRWDALLAGKRYRPEWILEHISPSSSRQSV